jgi:signal transduction histidine kinase
MALALDQQHLLRVRTVIAVTHCTIAMAAAVAGGAVLGLVFHLRPSDWLIVALWGAALFYAGAVVMRWSARCLASPASARTQPAGEEVAAAVNHQFTEPLRAVNDAEGLARGHPAFRPEPADINQIVRRVVAAQAHRAEEKRIGLLLDLSDQLPFAELDPRLVERLVANLLGNAVQFTSEDGAIRISTRQRSFRVILEVWDSGPGVPAELEGTLFEKFTRQKDSPGIGLGLYVCKSIVDAHRGTIAMRRTGGGVAFVAELPVAQPEDEATYGASTEPAAAVHRPEPGGVAALARALHIL